MVVWKKIQEGEKTRIQIEKEEEEEGNMGEQNYREKFARWQGGVLVARVKVAEKNRNEVSNKREVSSL